MSPEQARGRPVDKRADIWAFGAVWFEMLTGRAPFPGETITDVIAAVVTREPDWTHLPADTPPLVRRLIARCLEKDPKQRLRDIGEVRLALAGNAHRGGGASGPGTRGRATRDRLARVDRRRRSAAGARCVSFLAAYRRRAGAERRCIKYDVCPPGKSALRLDSRPAVAISPDGSTIVFAATEEGVTKLYLRRRNDAEVRALPGTEGGSDPAFSPDGRSLAFAGSTERDAHDARREAGASH